MLERRVEIRRDALICLVLAAATLAVYTQVRNHEFLDYDDKEYVTENYHVQAGLTRQSVAWAFTTGYFANWHPLTWLSHMVDCGLFGLNSAGHHLSSVFLHAVNAVLLFLVLHRMTRKPWRCALVAALFAVHPLHVESVAWLAERKDVLSTLFWLLTMWAYVRYVEKPGPGRYLLVAALFALGLMAKPMLVTLPFVLLLLDYWPLERFRAEAPNLNEKLRGNWRLVVEKFPLFALTAASCTITIFVQHHAGAVSGSERIALRFRAANALVAYVTYIGKMLWPARLAVLYPHPRDTLPLWRVAGAALLLVAASILALWNLRKWRYPAVGWLWYVGTLLPVIGLVQVGSQAMADRYTYVPLIGLFVIIAWGVPDLFARYARRRMVLVTPGAAVLLALMVCTGFQVRHWRNTEALFKHALAVTSNNYVAHNNLGYTLLVQGETREAAKHFVEALRIRPDHVSSQTNLGVALLRLDRGEEALVCFSEALRLDPDNGPAHNGLGMALNRQGRTGAAIDHFTKALAIRPSHVEAHVNLGNALLKTGRVDDAILSFRRALSFRPDHEPAHVGLGIASLRKNRPDQAVEHFARALELDPDNPETHNSLGTALAAQRKMDEAVAHFTQALRLKPDYANARRNLERALRQKQQTK